MTRTGSLIIVNTAVVVVVASKESQRVILVYVAKIIVIGAGDGSTTKLGGGMVADAARNTDGGRCAPAHVSIAQHAKTDNFSTQQQAEEYCSHMPLNKCIRRHTPMTNK